MTASSSVANIVAGEVPGPETARQNSAEVSPAESTTINTGETRAASPTPSGIVTRSKMAEWQGASDRSELETAKLPEGVPQPPPGNEMYGPPPYPLLPQPRFNPIDGKLDEANCMPTLGMPPFFHGLQQDNGEGIQVPPGGFDNSPWNHRIVVLHERTGIRAFERGWEAALFLLLTEAVSLSDFIKLAGEEKRKLLTDPQHFGENDLWKYHLLKDGSIDSGGKDIKHCLLRSHNGLMGLRSHNDPNDLENAIRTKVEAYPPSVRALSYDPNGRVSSNGKMSGEEGIPRRTRRGRACNKNGKGQGPEVDVSLAHTMHIPLTHGGELINFSDVKEWVNPEREQLDFLRRRIITEWMEPLQLRQQDIVKATGVGAPYVCYLFKDPENPNMTQRRRVEAYSVLSELFRKYDNHEILPEHFLNLKNNRIQNRYHKRHAINGELRGGEDDVSGTENEDAIPTPPGKRRRTATGDMSPPDEDDFSETDSSPGHLGDTRDTEHSPSA